MLSKLNYTVKMKKNLTFARTTLTFEELEITFKLSNQASAYVGFNWYDKHERLISLTIIQLELQVDAQYIPSVIFQFTFFTYLQQKVEKNVD